MNMFQDWFALLCLFPRYEFSSDSLVLPYAAGLALAHQIYGACDEFRALLLTE